MGIVIIIRHVFLLLKALKQNESEIAKLCIMTFTIN